MRIQSIAVAGWMTLLGYGCSGATTPALPEDGGRDSAETSADGGPRIVGDAGHDAEVDSGPVVVGDAGHDAAPDADGGVMVPGDAGYDAAPDADSGVAVPVDASVCRPGDVSSFVAPPYKSAARKPGACTPALVDAFYMNCLDSSAAANRCSASFGAGSPAANRVCAACLLSPETAATYGAVVDATDTLTLNLAGCMELKGNRTCAEAVQRTDACQASACRSLCPVVDEGSMRAYVQCTSDASVGGCKPYADAESACTDASADGGAGYECFAWRANPSPTFEDIFRTVAPVFCQ